MNFIVIGNGESRRGIDLSLINEYKIGCNLSYRYEKLDEIVCVDTPARNYATQECNLPILTRDPFHSYKVMSYYQDKEFIRTSTLDRGFSSGNTALEHVATIADHNDSIYILGFDFFYDGIYVNHMYKNTSNHFSAAHKAINTYNFKQQSYFLWRLYRSRNFIWVNNQGLDKLEKFNNVWVMTPEEFKRIMINI